LQKKEYKKRKQVVDVEAFIAVKVQSRNQLTADKLKQVNLLESPPYEEPVEEIPEPIVLNDEETGPVQLDDDGQITMSLD
jgi:topoisomerase-4 subunit A